MRKSLISLSMLAIGLIGLGLSCGEPQDGGVFRSLDSAESWEQKVFVKKTGRKTETIAETNITTMQFQPTDANIIYLGTKGSGLYATLTGGEQWFALGSSSGTVNSIAIDPVDPRNIYIGKGTSILKSTDEGVTWETVYQDAKGGTISGVVVDSFEHSRVYAATSVGTVIKSYDYGINWDLRMQIGGSIKRLLIAKHDTRVLYVLTSKADLYITTNGGEFIVDDLPEAERINSGWQLLLPKDFDDQFPDGDKITDVTLDPNDTTVVYLVTRRGLMRGTDSGTNWSDVITLIGANDKKNDSIRNLTITPGNSQIIYFSVAHAIHKSTDGGANWKIIENFPSKRNITALLIDYQTPNVIYAGTEAIEKQGGLIKTK